MTVALPWPRAVARSPRRTLLRSGPAGLRKIDTRSASDIRTIGRMRACRRSLSAMAHQRFLKALPT